MLKIKEIVIERFRSIKNIKLAIDPTHGQTAFCGQNNVGKTNTLRAINVFFNPDNYQQEIDMPKIKIATGGATIHPKVTITFIDDSNNKFKISRDIGNYLNNQDEGLSGKKNNSPISVDEAKNLLKSCVFIFIESVNIFMPDLIEMLTTNVIDIKYDKARFSNLKKDLKTAYDAYIEGLQNVLDNFANEISSTFKNFQPSWSVKFSTPESPQKFREMISDEVSLELDDNGSLGISNKGAGLQRLAAILLYFETLSRQKNKKNIFVCIDEPDVYLHEGLQRKLKMFFDEKTTSMQLFYTTHSKIFVNAYNLQNVFLLSAKFEKQFSVRKQKNIDVAETVLVDLNEDVGYEMICEHLGIERDEYEPLKQNNIIVEGNCDKNYIQSLCNYFGIPVPNIISLNGCTNIEKYLNFFESYYKNTEKNEKPFIKVLFDNDHAGNECFNNIKKKISNYPHLDLEILRIPNFLGETPQNNPNNEIEDFIYPEVFCFLLNSILPKMKLKKIDVSEVTKRLKQKAFQNQGILAICEILKNEKNPDDGSKITLTSSSNATSNLKESLSKHFNIEGKKAIQRLLMENEKKYPAVREFLKKISSFPQNE